MVDLVNIRTILFDMDGVLYRGKQVLPGVREIIAFCKQQKIVCACITNNATLTSQQYDQKLTELDILIPGSHVIGSAIVTNLYLREQYPSGTTVYIVGMDGLHELLLADNYFILQEQKPQIVVQSADLTLTYQKLKTACLAIRAGARFIATNTDRSFPTEEGLAPGSGAITAAIQAATDVTPFVIGKPQPIIFQTAINLLDSTPETTLMIGDRLETDILGAKSVGIHTALVLTGVTKRIDLANNSVQPDFIFDDLLETLKDLKKVYSNA